MCFLSKREQVRLGPLLMAVTVRHTTRVAMLAAARLANDRQASDDAAEAKTAEAASVANYQGWLARLAKGGAEAVAGADRAVSGVGGGGWVKPAWWGSQEAVAVREWRMSDGQVDGSDSKRPVQGGGGVISLSHSTQRHLNHSASAQP